MVGGEEAAAAGAGLLRSGAPWSLEAPPTIGVSGDAPVAYRIC